MTRTTRVGWWIVGILFLFVGAVVGLAGWGCGTFLIQEELISAGCQGDIAAIRRALALGAKIDGGTSDTHRLALPCAAGNGNDEAARFLLSRGANPYKEDKNGGSAYAVWLARGEWPKWKPLVRVPPPDTR